MTKPPVVYVLSRICWHNVAFSHEIEDCTLQCSRHSYQLTKRPHGWKDSEEGQKKEWESSRTIWHIDKVPFEFMLTIWSALRHVLCNPPVVGSRLA
jgi:hypothetical protein